MKIRIKINDGEECYDLVDEESNLDHDGDKANELICKVYEWNNAKRIADFLESKPKRPVSRQDVLRIALEVGFSISTAYGQESGKLMPISDSKTLERFAQALAEINEGEKCS